MFRSLMTRTVALALAFAGVLNLAGNASAAYRIHCGEPDGNNLFLLDNASSGGMKDNNFTIGIIELTNLVGGPSVYSYGGGTLTLTTLTTNAATNSLAWRYDVTFSGPGASGPVTLEFSRTGYSAPAAGLSTLVGSVNGAFASGSTGTVTAAQGYGATNLLDANTTILNHGTFLSSAPFSNNLSTSVVSATPYSLTSTVTLNFAASGQFTGNGSISLANAIPVPAGLVLALTGLPALGLFTRQRRRTVQV